MILAAASSLLLFVGTYATPSERPQGGIYAVTFDPGSGRFENPHLAATTSKPTFLALHPKGHVLYATTDLQGYEGPSDRLADCFSIRPGTRKLEPLPRQIPADLPRVDATVDPSGQALYTASYRANAIESFPLDEAGNPLGRTSLIRNQGRPGPRTDRQDASHPHCITRSPDGRHLYVCDLGLDRIYCYRPGPGPAWLNPAVPAFTQTPPGSGPRHMALSRDGAFAYVIGELDSTLSTYARNADTGALSLLQRSPTLPEGYDGPNTGAEVAIHPNGRFLYASNRGHDSIAIYGRDPRNGLLTPIGNVPCGGRHPRHFALSPDGAWLICANRDSNNLVSFRVNPATGALVRSSTLEGIPKPTCVLFMPPEKTARLTKQNLP